MTLTEHLKVFNEFIVTQCFLPRSLTIVESYVLYTLYVHKEQQMFISQVSGECRLSVAAVHDALRAMSDLGKDTSKVMNPFGREVGLVEFTGEDTYRKWCKISWLGILFIEEMGWNKFENRERMKRGFIESGKKMFEKGKLK